MTRTLFDPPLDILERRFQALQESAASLPGASRQELETALQELSQAIAALRADREAGESPPAASPTPCEAMLRHVFNAIPDLLTIHDRDFNTILSNWRGYESVPEAERQGQPKCYRVYHHRDRPCDDCHALEVLAKGQPVKVEKVNPVDGRVRQVSAYPIRDESGRVVLVAEHVRDITERKQAEDVLQTQTRVMESMIEAVTVVSEKGHIVYANQASYTMFGYPEGELIGQPVTVLNDLPSPENERFVRRSIEQLRKKGTWLGEVSNRTKAGTRFTTYARVSTLKLGGKTLWVSVQEDITERKRAEAALEESEERFRHISSTISDISYSCTSAPDGGYAIDWLAGAVDCVTGYSVEEIKAQRCWSFLVIEADQPRFEQHITGLAAGASGACELRLRHKNGGIVWVASFAKIVQEPEQPELLHIYGGLVDITARKQGEEELRESERQKSVRNEILQIFLTRPDEDIYGEVLQVILKTMESRFGVFAYQDEHGALVAPSMTWDIWEQCNIPDKTIRFPPETWGDTIWARAIRQKQSLWKNEPGLVPEGHVPIENVMVVPLLYRDEVFAHFVVANKKGGYSESDKDWLEGIAQFIAPVLHARLERDRKEAKRQQAEAALAAHLQFLQLLLDTIPNPIFFKDAQGAYLGCNKAFEGYLGVTRQEIVGKSVYDLSPRELADEYHRMDLATFQTTGTQVYESLVQAADGARRHVMFHKATFPDPTGGVGGLVGIITDITDLKQVEELLALHATRLQALLDLHLLAQAPQKKILDFVLDAVLTMMQSEYAFIGLMDEAESVMTIHRWSGKAMERCSMADKPILYPISGAGLWGDCVRQRTAVLCNDYQAPHPSKKGLPEGHVPIRRILAVPVLDGGRIVALAAVANKGKDYTEDDVSTFTSLLNKMWEILSRKQAEAELRESEQRFRLMAETIQDVFWMGTPEIGKLVYVSPAYEQVWGRTCQELYQSPQSFIDAIHPEDRERVRSEVLAGHRQGTPWNHEYRIIKPDGAGRWLQDRGFPVRDDQGRVIMFTGVATDVTEHKALEAQLHQAQKMEAVGRLAGGVAHDFNNLLMAIMGYGELMRAKVHKDDLLYGYLENILKAGDRATALTQQLLAFSRQKIVHPQVIDLNRVVLDLEPMLRRLIGEDLDLEVVTAPKLGAVRADPGQLGQIIMNLVVNARDAMPQGGRLTLSTAAVNFTVGHHSKFRLAPPGAYVMLEVADTGVGMDEATQAHVFEPFFTTKEPGKGTGLGLSTVYGIVRQSGGYLDLESEPGAGSTFTIYLPRLDAVVPPPKAKIPITASFRGEETVLLVEDEDVLRALLAKFLRLYGYSVLEARHGGEALLTCERHQGPIHLMVTDVVMPQMSGRELADRLTPLRPEMKVLYMSGYTEDAVVQHGVADLSVAFLQKPFRPIELARLVYAVLHPPESQ